MGLSLPSRRVVRVLNELVALHGRPSAVRVDNGPEFTARPFVDWCAEHGVATHYIQPGKPDQNAYIKRFNRSYRTEVLNAHHFESLAEGNRERSPNSGCASTTRSACARQPRPGAAWTFLPRPTTAGLLPGTVRLTGSWVIRATSTTSPPAKEFRLEEDQEAEEGRIDEVMSTASSPSAPPVSIPWKTVIPSLDRRL